MTRPAAKRKPRAAVLRAADARRAARMAIDNGCAVEVTTPAGLVFRFTPLGPEATPELTPYQKWKRDQNAKPAEGAPRRKEASG